ncbi:DotD/TraH family lipoprotein [Burkholderia ubonensis]|nr:DotD/TraH family lipoprotein [Burkholderia ubonensis]
MTWQRTTQKSAYFCIFPTSRLASACCAQARRSQAEHENSGSPNNKTLIARFTYASLDTEFKTDQGQALDKRKTMQLTRVTLVILLGGIAGCAQPPVAVDTTGRMLDAQLNESAQKIDRLLGDISRAGGLSALAPRSGSVTINGDLVTVQWQGDAPEVLRKLADAKGLKFAVMGRAVPIPVSIDTTNSNFVQVLENIGTQLGARADVVLRTDTLEIHYRAI